jgi:hypothetical protein
MRASHLFMNVKFWSCTSTRISHLQPAPIDLHLHTCSLNPPPKTIMHFIKICQKIGWVYNYSTATALSFWIQHATNEILPSIVAYVPINSKLQHLILIFCPFSRASCMHRKDFALAANTVFSDFEGSSLNFVKLAQRNRHGKANVLHLKVCTTKLCKTVKLP